MRDQPTPEQIAKLPKWAQEHIRDLENIRNSAEKRLRDYLDNRTKSGIYIGDITRDEKFYLQDDRVTFEVPEGEIHVALEKNGPEKGQLIVRGVSQPLQILPKCSNTFNVRMER